jgi:hypothetical protein
MVILIGRPWQQFVGVSWAEDRAAINDEWQEV